MMCSVYRLNKQGDRRQPCCTPFTILNQSVVPYRVLTNCCLLTLIQVSQEPGKMVWYSHLFKSFPQFVMIHIVKGITDETEVDFFWNSLAFSTIQWMTQVVDTCHSQSPSLPCPPLPPCPHVHSLHLCLYFCLKNRFIWTTFLDSTYMH